jgi:hypothetical protein
MRRLQCTTKSWKTLYINTTHLTTFTSPRDKIPHRRYSVPTLQSNLLLLDTCSRKCTWDEFSQLVAYA